jgi:MFS family permease
MKKSEAFAVWRIRDYRLFTMARFFLTFAIQMQSVVVGWQVYEYTKDAFSLGLIGLAEAIPFLTVALFAGHVADVFERKKVIVITASAYLLAAFALFLLSYQFSSVFILLGVIPIYGIIFFTGIARGFLFPSVHAFIAQIVPRELYANSSTWNSTVWHIAAVTGPATGGLVYGFFGINAAYASVVVCMVIVMVMMTIVKGRPLPAGYKKQSIFASLKEGLHFVFKNQVILGALSLDMFAVLFGGAIILLPVFAAEVLFVGPKGLGFLRAAPAFGAVIMSLILAYRPPLKKAGRNLLFGVTGFGICIILFAISRDFVLSLIILVLSGMFDNISVIIRSTTLQLLTPDEMRGRVSSVNSIFVGSSNEIGSFESGLAARLMGLIPSVIFGGSMTLFIAGFTARFAPKLRKLNLKEFLKNSNN